MEFNEQLKQFSERLTQLQPNIQTEEATKMSMIVPFFQLMGYDVFNPAEFCPEFSADVGIKKGEKVDYAILQDDKPLILIECKWCGEALDKHSSQLFRYFSTTSAKFGILTNGIIYRFYTDLEEMNKMDLSPFFEINLSDIKEYQITELKKFCKANFDSDKIFSTASELKYTSMIKSSLSEEFNNPSEKFVRFLLDNIYEGLKTQKVIEKFTPIVKKSFTGFVNDLVNQKISSALTTENGNERQNIDIEPLLDEAPKSKIITTEEEIEAFHIVRGMLAEVTNFENIVYRDTESYFGILFTDNNRKPICRFNFDTKRKQILIPDENKVFTRYYLESLNEISQYKNQLIEVVQRYL